MPNGLFQLTGNPSCPVVSGQTFAVLAVNAGENVQGDPLELDLPEEASIGVDGYLFDQASGELRSTVFGKVDIRGNSILVQPVLRVSDDSLEAVIDVYPCLFSGQAMTWDILVKEVGRIPFTAEIQKEGMRMGLDRALRTDKLQPEILVARGDRSFPGVDGRLEILVSQDNNDVGTAQENGRVDFRDRGSLPTVEAGQDLAVLHPPGDGRAGRDVFGKMLPNVPGKAITINLGQNIEKIEEDGGKSRFVAVLPGIFKFRAGTISVSEMLEINGDVDFKSGNVAVEQGSVLVRGIVRSGFTVTAAEHLIVQGLVESASIEVGGDVSVKGGILMDEGERKIEAAGNVQALFATGANIRSGLNVVLANGCNNCDIFANKVIEADGGKGQVMGGHLISHQGINIKESGSPLGVKTILEIAIVSDEYDALVKRFEELRDWIERIDTSLGSDDMMEVLSKTPEEEKRLAVELIKVRSDMNTSCKQVKKMMFEEMRRGQNALGDIHIKVQNKVYAGTEIRIGDKALQIDKTMGSTIFHWDSTQGSIVSEGL